MLKVTRITGAAASGKTTALQAIHDAMTSQGRRTFSVSGHARPESVLSSVQHALLGGPLHDAPPLVILLDEGTEATIKLLTETITQPCYLYASIIG